MTTKMFDKVLIANRGEIACRIMGTCHKLRIRTVAVYSDADALSMHVRLADEAICIGAAPAQESYLAGDKIIAAARQVGAQAIHPGYGFLSENENFARACADAGIVFIGPPPNAIHAMGSKSAAKALMSQAGVPLTPGYHGDNQDADFLRAQADTIGYPVLIKASAGGGGKGMRRVDAHADFTDALASCKREASASFGDDRVLVEKYILRPRHVEIQVFADTHGNVVSLFERDCSVQRRHQKVLEEAPAPGMTAARREAMSKAACDAARAVGYVGAGTVEFIADATGAFHFMEMNTRLQVEHPVTEMITGLDLVELQLAVAAGAPLPFRQQDVRISGHAIEARVYAEDPANDFLPSIGTLAYLRTPQPSKHVRVDAGVEQGDTISSFYDPMIAKLIVWDETRESALSTMTRALADFQVAGVETNIEFLKKLVATASFSTADLDTGLIEREAAFLFTEPIESPAQVSALAALAVIHNEYSVSKELSPWNKRDGWRLNSVHQRHILFSQNGVDREICVDYENDGYVVRAGSQTFHISCLFDVAGVLTATMNGSKAYATFVWLGSMLSIFTDGSKYEYVFVDPSAERTAEPSNEASLLAPLPGLVTSTIAQPGELVERGAPLLTLEAMKMEYTIKAPMKGSVQAFFFAVGDQVTEGAQLLQFEPSMKENEET